MKKLMGKLSFILLTCFAMNLFAFAAAPFMGNTASAATSGDWGYEVQNDGTASVTSYNGTASSVVIPSSIDGHKVVEVVSSTFYNNKNIRAVTIPDSVTQIGSYAFSGCTSLSNVVMSKSIESIDHYAFINCPITSIYIPKSLVSVGCGVFQGTLLKEVTFEEGITRIPANLLESCESIEQITIPDTLTQIGSSAFLGCTSLSSVTIPDSVTQIGISAFNGCISLSSVTMSKSVESIDNYAFSNCPITSIYIPKSLASVGLYVFQGTSLKEVTFEEGITRIPANLLYNCESIEQITIPDTVTQIGYSAFEYCSSLSSVTIPDSVTQIGHNAFNCCSSLSSVLMSKSVESIDNYAFSNCPITSIYIPKSLVSVGWGVFQGTLLEEVTFEEGITRIPANLFESCEFIEQITIPDTVTQIGYSAFEYCTSLSSVTIPNSVTQIGYRAFYGCTLLSSVTIPDSVTQIGIYAFSGCTSLSHINLPEGLKTIGSNAFYECGSLTEITIPSGVTYIGSSAFYNCDGLKKAAVYSSETVGSQAFYDCDALESIEFGEGITEIGSSICYSCDSLSEIKFGRYIETIPDSAFRLCSSLTTVTLPRFCTTVASNAFAEDTKLASVYVPPYVTSIQTNSFSYPAKTTMYGKEGSYAQGYAEERGMQFTASDIPVTTLAYTGENINISRYSRIYAPLQIMPEFDTDVITFSSDNEDVATVSDTGKIYARSYGSANITAVTDSGLSSSIRVNVIRPASSITLNNSSLELSAGKSSQLTAALSPDNSTDIIEWSSDNTSVAVVDKNGMVTAVKKGTAAITARAVYGNKSASCIVTVLDSGETVVEVTGITLAPQSKEIIIGNKYTLSAKVMPANATNKMIVWSSSNSGVASVEDGVVTANSVGSATITAKTVSGGYTATCTVTVLPKVEITSFTVSNMSGFGLVNLSAVNVPAKATVFLAGYDSADRLISLKTLALSNGSVQDIIPLENIKRLKVFIWDAETLEELCAFKEATI